MTDFEGINAKEEKSCAGGKGCTGPSLFLWSGGWYCRGHLFNRG